MTRDGSSRLDATQELSYRYYTEFQVWNGNQSFLTDCGAIAGLAIGEVVSLGLQQPYNNYQAQLQFLEEDRSLQISKQQINRDTKAITELTKHKPSEFTATDTVALTLGSGVVMGTLVAATTLGVRRLLHWRRVRQIEAESDKIKQTLDLIDVLCEPYKEPD